MTARTLIFALLLAVLVGAAAYFYRDSVDTAGNGTTGPKSETIVNERSTANEVNAESTVQTGAAKKSSDLDRLVSTDDAIRESALKHLAYEFHRTAEPRYQRYGSDLLPVLHRVISDLDDEYAHYAIEAVSYMTAVNQMRVALASDALDVGVRQEYTEGLEELGHYPVPSSYPPMKEALINALTNSESYKARYWSAMTLATGFEPRQDTEQVFARQLPLEEDSYRVQGAIIEGLAAVGRSGGFEFRSTENAIMDSLASSNVMTQRSAARLVGVHRFDDGIEQLIENIPAATDVNSLKVVLRAIVSYEGEATAYIAELEAAAENTNDERWKTEILSAIQKIRNASAE